MRRILVVDDDPHLREVVVYALEREGFAVETAPDGRLALERLGRAPACDLVILDILMPEMDGLEVCRTLRRTDVVPVVFLSSRDEELDKVIGLELGGDDYVTKPFSPRELVARVRAVLRRAEQRARAQSAAEQGEPPRRLQAGRITVDLSRHEVSFGGAPVRLTVTEFGLLQSLAEHPDFVLSRSQLMERAYAYDNLITDRTIDTHIKRIRRKFKDVGHDPIETVHGVGYRLRP
jgi:two-component system OmpR family response regulator